MIRRSALFANLACMIALTLVACAPAGGGSSTPGAVLSAVSLQAGEKLQVVATTSIVADIARNVGGERISLSFLLPVGTDPHTFEPTPRDAATISRAHVILANGAGLEAFLERLLSSAGGHVPVVDCSSGLALRRMSGPEAAQHGGVDPHTWNTAANARQFAANIARAFSVLDPANASAYQANASAYQAQLQELDAWIKAQIDTLPAGQRNLVTDHDSFGYYADAYGLQVVGTVIPSYSTESAPSAQQIAALSEAIRKTGARAIFVDTTVNPALAQRIASDTGIRLVPLFSGSLGAAGSGADTYISYMRYNTSAIVKALQ
jgi:ABC-type Zn uptake system ZnuABC Zn-binding protein ZnuA